MGQQWGGARTRGAAVRGHADGYPAAAADSGEDQGKDAAGRGERTPEAVRLPLPSPAGQEGEGIVATKDASQVQVPANFDAAADP